MEQIKTVKAKPCWLKYDEATHFPIENLPYGVGRTKGDVFRCYTRIGNYVIDLAELEQGNYLNSNDFSYKNGISHFNQNTLNSFIGLGKKAWLAVRNSLTDMFQNDKFSTDEVVRRSVHELEAYRKESDFTLVMPFKPAEYTDFYSSKNHAFNMGNIIRGPENALQPNWSWLPVGYHGRASTIVVTGTDIIRPRGQIKPSTDPTQPPVYSECKKMDFEVEMGVVIGAGNEMGKPIPVDDAHNYIFGYVLLNDWSARDLQVWEYVPLGPFTAKNFGTSISPWVITPEALEPFKVKLPEQSPKPLSYLDGSNLYSYDIQIEVHVSTDNKKDNYSKITTSNYKYMYWTAEQQIAHHTVSGCKLNPADVLASGTISGTSKDAYGCLFELTWNGKEAIKLDDGKSRTWLEDGDSVKFIGYSKGTEYTIGFGECEGTVLPALK